jgi:hypothetical protein
VLPWIQAFMWAFKPTDVIDVRRFPREEAMVIAEENARQRGASPSREKPTSDAKPVSGDKPGN